MSKSLRWGYAFFRLAFLLLIGHTCFIQQAQAFQGGEQKVTIRAESISLGNLFKAITKQTGLYFVFYAGDFNADRKVTVDYKAKPVEDILQDLLAGSCTWTYNDNKVRIRVKDQPPEGRRAAAGSASAVSADTVDTLTHITIAGRVTDKDGAPLVGATVLINGRTEGTTTDGEGKFVMEEVPHKAALVVSYVGYETQEIRVNRRNNISVKLQPVIAEMNAVTVLSTGYQTLPKERATGSFVKIDNELLNRRVSMNILDRLEGVASGVLFNMGSTISSNTRPGNEKLGISIRGRSTIDDRVNADPLIVLDNFPYEGDVKNINPNDIESITVLKDAAASSIWGSRAGNGVIVITTKRGKYNQKLRVELNSNVTISEKPNLSYSKKYLNSAAYIGIEKLLFEKGYFDADFGAIDMPVISPVVEALAKRRDGQISGKKLDELVGALERNDTRSDFSKYIYRKKTTQQHSILAHGGGENSYYMFSVGYDKNLDALVRNNNDRITINASNTFRPIKNLEVTTGVNYVRKKIQDNTSSNSLEGINLGGTFKYQAILPYLRLADDNGNPLSIPRTYRSTYIDTVTRSGFLNWQYKPLEEIGFSDNTYTDDYLLLRSGVRYKISDALNLEAQYQYEKQVGGSRSYSSLNTFYTRDLINQFYNPTATSANLKYPIPKGGILDLVNNTLLAHNLRGQINYNKTINSIHNISGIVGGEIRSVETSGFSRRSYGYNDETGTSVSNLDFYSQYPQNPAGYYGNISAPDGNVRGTLNRFISYYANASYAYDSRYTLYMSARRDGANIFGVNTNDKITPLWSIGMGWELSNEKFYKVSVLPYLKVRASYGFQGNVYNASAYLTANSGGTSYITGLPISSIMNPPNKDLRWERVKNINFGVDYAFRENIISGSFEVFRKEGLDLIETAPLAPSTGFIDYKGNAASTVTKGLDLTLNAKVIDRQFKWYSAFLLSYISDKVTHYDVKYYPQTLTKVIPSGSPEYAGVIPVIGRPMFGIYSYRWMGLDPETGAPLGFWDGKKSNDYYNLVNNTPLDSLVFHGSGRPKIFGSFRNTFAWKGISLSFNIVYKLGYYFRKYGMSTNYTDLLKSPHDDYDRSWRNPGDEKRTNIPSLTYPEDNNRRDFYHGSSIMVEKGDHVRLQDIAISYDLDRALIKGLPFDFLQLKVYINNIGLLWRANKAGIDPDVFDDNSVTAVPNPKSVAIGIKVGF